MATTFHRGYCIQSGADKDIWHVRIKKQVFSGNLPAVKNPSIGGATPRPL